jgi:hypothetical protein
MNPTLRLRGGWGTRRGCALKTMSTHGASVGESQEQIYSECRDPAALDELQAAVNIRRIENSCWTFPDATPARPIHPGIAL